MGGGGKSGSSGSQTYDYYGTLAGGVCVGPVDELVSIILNGEAAWPRGGTAWAVGINCAPGVMYVFDAQTWTCTAAHVASLANAPGSGLQGWKEYTFKYHGSTYDDFSLYTSDGTFQGVLRFYWGTAAQTADYYLQSANNDGGVKGKLGAGDQHPDYKGVCYCVLIDFLLGQEVQSGPNVEIVVRRKPNQALMTGNSALITDGQANIAAALCEILTDPNCLGLPTSMIDTASFQAVANYLDTNGANYNCSILIDSAESLRSVLDKLIQMFDGFIRFNSATQKIELGVYQHGVSPAGYMNVVTLTMDALTKHPQFSTTSWQATFSRATVQYNSRQLAYQQTSVFSDDPRAFFVLGVTRDQSLDRPYITREGQAIFHGRETLRVIGHAQMKGTLEVRREIGRNIRAGDFVFVDVDLEPNGASIFQYFRVTQRRWNVTGPITLDLFADNTLAPVPFSTPYPTTPPGSAAIAPIASLRLVQVPDDLSGEHNAIVALAVRPDNLIAGCQLYFDTARVLSTTITSLVADGTGAKAVITFAAAPGFQAGDPIDVSCSGNTAFNVNLGTVTAVAGNTVTYALVAAVAANLAATGTITVADYYATFSNLGTIPNFAAKATLYSAVAAGNGTVTVTVDTTQADADYFTHQYSANDAANDALVLFMVSLVASGGDAGQVAESGGFGIIEICSVSTQTLVAAGRYQLTVLRGRQGTSARAFTIANTECWLIQRSALAFFTSGAFDIIRANRTANTVPQYAQFRFCPYSFAGQLPLSSATNHQFRFPLKSAGAPALSLTTPATTNTITNSGATLPFRQEVSGTWSTTTNNLVEAIVAVRLATETSDRVIKDFQFAPTGSFSFDVIIPMDAPGSWTIKLTGRDINGLTTEVDIPVNITGGVPTCAPPELYDCNGGQIFPGTGWRSDYTEKQTEALVGWGNGSPNQKGLWCKPQQYIPFGPFQMTCSTPGASIQFWTQGAYIHGGVVSQCPVSNTWLATNYSAAYAPFHTLLDPGTLGIGYPVATVCAPLVTTYGIIARATAPGYAASPVVVWLIPLLV